MESRHDPSCPTRTQLEETVLPQPELGIGINRDVEMAMQLQMMELHAAQVQRQERAWRRNMRQAMAANWRRLQRAEDVVWDPLWGEKEFKGLGPSVALWKSFFSCCPCFFIGCRKREHRRAWFSFLLSWSSLIAFAQVAILIAMIVVDGGLKSTEVNPMIGPGMGVMDLFGAKNTAKILTFNQWWRVLMPMLTHVGWVHLVGNLVVQLRTGSMLEAVWGGTAWIFMYIVTGVFATLCSCVISPNALGVGSSGALCGLIGAWLAFILITWNQTLPADIKLRNVQAVSVAVSVVIIIGFSFLPMLDWAAHLGGLAMGLTLAMATFANRLQHDRWRWGVRISGWLLSCALFALVLAWFLTRTKFNPALLTICANLKC